jgi:hypothetical protein
MTGLDLSSIDDDPFKYFLAPVPSSDDEDDDLDTDMLDFDAGIEDSTRPLTIVRSVSPSSLDGGRLPTTPSSRASLSPSLDDDLIPTPDDNDSEQYIHLTPGSPSPLHHFGLPLSLKDFALAAAARKRPERKAADRTNPAAAPGLLLAPESPQRLHMSYPSATAVRGRSTFRFGPRPSSTDALGPAPFGSRRTRSLTALGGLRRRSPHSWREPSPDVWSIEEEPEDGELDGEESKMETHYVISSPRDIKTKKKVRFVLPGEDIIVAATD